MMQQEELNQQNLIAYRQRWQAVSAVEAAERESSSITERWRQMNAILWLAKSLNIVPPPEDVSLDEGRQRFGGQFVGPGFGHAQVTLLIGHK